MIDGLKLDVTAKELKAHCEARIRDHESRMEANEGRISTLRDAGLQEGGVQNTSMQSPIEGLRSSIKKHKQQASFFAFVADHIVTGEVYRFDDGELARLEFIEGRY